MRYFTLLLLLSLGLLAGCNIINPAEPIPTYVKIDSFTFVNANPAATAGSTHQIRSVFVTFEGKIIGTFDLPATVPVIMSGPGQLQVAPGVDNAGTVSNQILYPHYLGDTATIQPSPGNVVPVAARTGYVPASIFAYRENFESSNDFQNILGPTFTTTSEPGKVIDGMRSGYFELPANSRAIAFSNTGFTNGGGTAFLEIDYRSTVFLAVGFLSVSTQAERYITTLNPAPNGNKIYISLSTPLGQAISTAGYRVLLQAQSFDTAGWVSVDNIKVLTF